MATSGLYTFNRTRDQIIKDALEDLSVHVAGQTLDNNLRNQASARLEAIVKSYPNAPLWDSEVVVLSLTQSSTVIGSDTYYYDAILNHTSATNTKPITGALSSSYWVKIAETATAWATGTSYSVNNILTNGGSSYKCIKANTSASASEPGVGADTATYWVLVSAWVTATAYTSMRHISDLDVSIMDVDSVILREDTNQIILEKMNRDDWNSKEDAADPTNPQEPSGYFFEKKIQPILWIYPWPDSSTDYTIELTVFRYREDFNAASKTPDFPQEWLRALRFQLAVDMAPSKNRARGSFFTNLKKLRDEAVEAAEGLQNDKGDTQFTLKL